MQSQKVPNRRRSISENERKVLKKIGLKIHKDLFQQNKPIEQLAFDTGVARSSIREIIAGRSNPRLLTLSAIASGLGYSSLSEFLSDI